MAFNADEYIDVIVEQIAENFQELDKTVKACKALEEKEKKFRNTYDAIKYSRLELELKEQKSELPEVICNKYKSIEPLSVGLFGEWGSGKTHLLKLIESQVNRVQLDQKNDETKTFPQVTIPVFFNAWRFEKEEHMIIPLFQTMLTQLEEYEHMPLDAKAKKFVRHGLIKLKILGKALLKGLRVPEKISEVPEKIKNLDITVVADVLNADTISNEYDKKIKEELLHDELFKELIEVNRLESIYYNIPQWIEKITIADKINFVFLIDDLDRCLPENTLKMLESIKLFLDVPSCAFVLAIDDDVVERGVAYHYRDYLKDIVRVDGIKEKQVEELPITGHEYLEKMIQLPFRIPVITNTDVLEFLEENYKLKFSQLFKEDKPQTNEMQEGKPPLSKSDEIIKFFADTIPPKPRKIKRTAMLFQTKVKILQALEQHNFDHMLVAKLTLLELFAPKLLRFIQNNNYKEIFDVLHDFSNLRDAKDTAAKNSLENSSRIKNEIENYKNEGDRRTYTKLLEIVEENYHSRMVFKLDHIFKARIDKTILTEAMEQKVLEIIAVEKKELVDLLSKEFYTLLFGKTETQWRKAFDDNELFEEGKALLTEKAIVEVTKKAKAKDKKDFRKNPKWLLLIAEYITQTQFVKLLNDIYPYKMNLYQTTFEEYDKYCEATGVEKPNDEGWGRGKRPVINVSWEDATAYAKWLSGDNEGKYRLPTEDEWYLACNVGAKTKWHFGDDENSLKEYAWYSENSNSKTHPVGEKEPNTLGLYDMHGNVWEWCENWYDEKEEGKVIRGGSWFSVAYDARSADRYRSYPTYLYNIVGFRLLRTLP
ncbi:MAG: Unknown protein [uncultured Sulfurovum sp.]|uniref:Sulfatase-modifying factor enzyme domain-containing protein n=1 Tax=uncultured Sulfurovum sp. TaxID=269237 RepID=A0A6S6SUA6_9BACT|nr:MAG: Unknown protein [uncultured Sulfurovum sp.]